MTSTRPGKLLRIENGVAIYGPRYDDPGDTRTDDEIYTDADAAHRASFRRGPRTFEELKAQEDAR